ncbi:two-component system sensor histidine kinase RstB [Hafnia psychrotolerans]|uniref:histidine kinase n=1 Tax=Hafnia psychrotolerans TaxID=1477018 RepID=A0ABQ1GRK4_9GAMM|nr:two-component system sensor histidine kinase RstB [Hafnia psychrotolerans]GGA48756.1 two-component sensor histidine kinase [Hafnia psychrotolerans]
MKKLFIQFFLLLLVCFLVMSMLVGLVYKVTAERTGRQSMNDLMKSSLYLMRSELREIPIKDWNKTINTLELNLSFKLHIEPLGKRVLPPDMDKRLKDGEIIALDDEYTFIQRVPRSHYVLVVGPIPYLFYMHEMRILDLALMMLIGLSLAVPVFLWMSPHWKDLVKLENSALRLGNGYLDERTHFDSTSSLNRLGIAFNQMADNISTLIASKKQLIDGIAHELRTPLVRLRYRLAISENIPEAEQQAINRDIGQLEALIDELLTYARLDRPQVALNLEKVSLADWLASKINDFSLMNAENNIVLSVPEDVDFGGLDLRLMERVLDNLVNNALRYANKQLRISLWLEGDEASLQVEDDGPGIPVEERLRIFEPFVRLDPSRDRATGGCGLGLAIVHSIAVAYQGRVSVDASPSLGGACIRFTWPVKDVFNLNVEPS